MLWQQGCKKRQISPSEKPHMRKCSLSSLHEDKGPFKGTALQSLKDHYSLSFTGSLFALVFHIAILLSHCLEQHSHCLAICNGLAICFKAGPCSQLLLGFLTRHPSQPRTESSLPNCSITTQLTTTEQNIKQSSSQTMTAATQTNTHNEINHCNVNQHSCFTAHSVMVNVAMPTNQMTMHLECKYLFLYAFVLLE